MQFGCAVLAAVVIFGPTGAVQADDFPLEGKLIRSAEACREMLAEFNWLCRDFDRPEWIRAYGAPYWQVADILFYRHDIDGDGKDDGIVSTRGIPRCPRGGELCEHIVMFGGDAVPEKTRSLETRMWGYPILTTRKGLTGLYFDSSPQTFLSTDEIRTQNLSSHFFRP